MNKKLISILLILVLLLTACAAPQEPNDEAPVTDAAGQTLATDAEGSTVTSTDSTTDGETTTGVPMTDASGKPVTNADGSTVYVTTTTTTGGKGTTSTAGGKDKTTTKKTTMQTLPGVTTTKASSCKHKDADDNGKCDTCKGNLIVTVDFYNVNDLHGKLADGDNHPGVDELSTYLKNMRKKDDYALFLSSGDMWQGSSESNLTSGKIVTDWMNQMGFSAMTLGNHEYDWGTTPIKENSAFAQFPILAINVYDRSTDKRVSYCGASTVVDLGAVQVGIIGAMGDCYSSIASDKSSDVYFKTGAALTTLVREESQRLRQSGVDYVVYLIHDGYGQSKSDSATSISDSQIASYYDTSLSNGSVDLVFEAHTHQKYILKDSKGVYHLQNRGDNQGGISHVEISINSVTGTDKVNTAELVTSATYGSYSDDPVVNDLLNKYKSQINVADEVLGQNGEYRRYEDIAQLAADMYYQAGVEKWGKKYNIALGGGFMSVRSPYYLYAGEVTYGELMALLPFDNQIVLCSIKGRDLKSKFFETSNDRYYISYGTYGKNLKNNIDPNATYYIVTDTYTSQYKYNNLTEIARYDETTFARDLLAEYIRKGGLE